MKKILLFFFLLISNLFSSTAINSLGEYFDIPAVCYHGPYEAWGCNTYGVGQIAILPDNGSSFLCILGGAYGGIYTCPASSPITKIPPPVVGPAVTNSTLMPTGSNLVTYDDGSKMLILSDGTAFTFDANGNEISNLTFNGAIPPPSTPFTDNYVPNSNYKAKSFLDGLFFSGNGQPLLSPNSDGRLTLPIISSDIGGAQFYPQWLDTTITKSGDKITKTPNPTIEHPNAVSIDITSMNFDNIDFSEYENTASSTPTQVLNTSIVVEKIDATNQSKAPAVRSGTVLAHNNLDFSQFIASTPTTLSIGSQAPNGTVTQTTFQKADITNTLTNDTDLPFITEVLTPPAIQSDGTTTQTSTTITQGTSNPITGSVTATNPTTGTTTTTTNPTTGTSTIAGTTSPSGTGTIDLSGVTSRLDKISNQATKINEALSATETPSAVPDVLNPIDNSKFDGLVGTFKTAWNKASGDVDTLTSMISNAKDTVSGGFSLDLTTGYTETCPYISILDFGNGRTYDISIDFCKTFSPLKPISSIFFNIVFQLMIITFSFKSFLRLV